MRILIIGGGAETRSEVNELLKEWSGNDLEIVVYANEAEARASLGGSREPARVLSMANASASIGLTEQVESLEKRLVQDAMERTRQNQVRAAELLKITRGALQYKLKKYFAPTPAPASQMPKEDEAA